MLPPAFTWTAALLSSFRPALSLPQVPADSPQRILVGVEYIPLDQPLRTAAFARELAPIGFTTMKHYAEHVEWGAMQAGPLAPINFSRLDAFIREFQASGIRELVVCLRSASSWGSKHAPRLRPTNLAPKPQYAELYEKWITAVVERYDGDGHADMRGLRYPVRYYEIGSELSSYEPEPVEEYLAMLERAYRAAHAAFDRVIVAHAALLTTTAFSGQPPPEQYEAAFASMPKRIAEHSLSSIRKLLDRPELFDVLNIHSLGDPTEIEPITAWLAWETGRRGYRKPVLISDTATSPWVAWGPATSCSRPPAQMGVIVAPATEADRCRLARYFSRLVEGDTATVRWTQHYAAADNVKRVVIAAERGIVLINTAFVEDLSWFKLKPLGAGTGPSAWAGLVDLGRKERRAGYHALQQLLRTLQGYEGIARVTLAAPGVRVYEVRRGRERSWIAWFDPQRVILPGERAPTLAIELPLPAARVILEPLQTGANPPAPRALSTEDGRLQLTLTADPVFLRPAQAP